MIFLNHRPQYALRALLAALCLLSSRASAQICVQIPANVASWWRAEGNANDFESVNNGVTFSNVTFVQGIVGKAYGFDGNSSCIKLPDGCFPFPVNQAFTFETWFKTTVGGVILGQQADIEAYQPISGGFVPALYVGTDGRIHAELFNSGQSIPLTNVAVVTDGVFHHVAVTFDGSTQALYVDGALAASRSHSQIDYGAFHYKYQLGTGYTAGWPAGNGGWFTFNGLVDEATLYSRALSASEILSVNNAGNGGKCTTFSPVIYSQPTNQVVLTGSNVSIVIGASGPVLPSIQWFFYQTNLLAGQTNATLLLTNASLIQSGAYSAIVSNQFGSVSSSNATLTVLDPAGDADGDGLSNAFEIQLGTNPLAADSDGDGLSDYQEIYIYRTDPLKVDTDGDGMPDGWEVRYGLNPLADDSAEDADFDGLTNLQEYQYSLTHLVQLSPIQLFSQPDISDYAVVNGGLVTNRMYYDRNDRLLGMESSRGVSFAYRYDGNGNIVGQSTLSRTSESNGLPALFAYIHNLTNVDIAIARYGDDDGDGWSNYQELLAGSDPLDKNSLPDTIGLQGLQLGSFDWSFAPTNFVIATGELDGSGGEEIVISADGNTSGRTNFIMVLTRNGSNWTSQRVDIGGFGVTSLAIGQPTNREIPGIYAGLRSTSTGGVMEVRFLGGVWQTNMIAYSCTNQAQVLSVHSSFGIMTSMATTNTFNETLDLLVYSNGVWQVQLLNTNLTRFSTAAKGVPHAANDLTLTATRLLDSTNLIQVGTFRLTNRFSALPDAYTKALYRFDDGSMKDESPGGQYNGSFQNGATTSLFTTSGSGLSMALSGSAYATASSELLHQLPQGTIEATIYLQSITGIAPIFRQGTRQLTDVLFGVGEDGFLSWYVGGPSVTSSSKIPLNTWTKVAVSWDGSTIKLYINDILDSVHPGVAPPASGQTTEFGHHEASSHYYFQGFIDDIRVSTTATPPTSAFFQEVISFSETDATNRLVWGTHFLELGNVRRAFTNASSHFYAFIDGWNPSGTGTTGKQFVLAERVGSGTNWLPLAASRILLTEAATNYTYGIASVQFLANFLPVLFSAEPDGRVFSWVATNATGPLDRRLFSAYYAGKVWHALAGLNSLEPGEGLVGVKVDPNSPSKCDVIFWPPQSELWKPVNVPQTSPLATIITPPTNGNGLAQVKVRTWDAEGSPVVPELQFSTNGGASWLNATVVSVNGLAYGSFTAALPWGSTNILLWNAGQDLGAGVSNNVMLHVRAHDVSLSGTYSLPVQYRVDISTGNPIATNDVFTVLEDTVSDLDVLLNDAIQNGASKSIANAGQPQHGTTAVVGNKVRYAPATNYWGSDAFVYTLTDGAGGTNMATVTINVLPVNDPPSAPNFSFTTPEDTAFTLQWNADRDFEGDTVTLFSVSSTSTNGGTVTKVGNQVTYRPATNFFGTDAFTYTVQDNGKTAGTNDFKIASGLVLVTVSPVNDAPVISVPGAQSVAEDVSLVFTNISISDVDAGGGPLLVSMSVTNGALTLSATNGLVFSLGSNGASSMTFTGSVAAIGNAITNLTYRSKPNAFGTDTLTIIANDQGNTGAGGPLADLKSITIIVSSVNDLPVVALISPTNNAVFLTNEVITLMASASDIDGQIVKVEFFANASKIGETNATSGGFYTVAWSSGVATNVAIFARATDNQSGTMNSLTNMITIQVPGFVKLVDPGSTNGQFRMVLTGNAGQTYQVQASTDLTNWVNVGIATNVAGSVQFTDAFATNFHYRFYRAVVIP